MFGIERLSSSDKESIHKLYYTHNVSIQNLSKRFGVNPKQIRKVLGKLKPRDTTKTFREKYRAFAMSRCI